MAQTSCSVEDCEGDAKVKGWCKPHYMRQYRHGDLNVQRTDRQAETCARRLVAAIRKNASLDWNNKETVRSKLRSAVRRLLVVHKYPPDQQDATIDLVLQQAEVLGTDWTAA